MGTQELFDRAPDYQLEAVVDSALAHLRGKGLAGNVVKDDYRQVSPPEVATWTGASYQLALSRSGRETWMELRQFLPNVGRIPLRSVYAKADFAGLVCAFAQKESS